MKSHLIGILTKEQSDEILKTVIVKYIDKNLYSISDKGDN
jgi:DNA-binding PadR family transcriptional regulator